ncbi:calcium-translocating P-type ATPase [Chloropicon primus]|uniref:Calcium-transporting ATPase n=1 Tax=Chloropicon primus TaxID=1764295 RepID=A0A5B8MBB3_9CHLO|nr:calcium-translocating P-type ATPase [Chloropicon primus]UPQ96892.1 calcium-translocating P-type ATPase [Chloropicon primus]|eukprot:QDZ17676.1 calcium-translocating P-type ATPase [Chloropicon primus]
MAAYEVPADPGPSGEEDRPRPRSASQSQRNKDNWKKAVLVLNAARRFREAGGRKSNKAVKEGDAEAPAIKTPRSSQDLKEVMDIELGYDYTISPEELVDLLTLPTDIENLKRYGTSADIARKLKVNTACGVETKEVQKRLDYFGSNVIPDPPHKKFLAYVWDACQDVTLIILMFCAVASLIAGLAAEGVEEGWYDGVGISVAIVAVIMITAVQDYRQDLQFRELDAKTKDIILHVTRDGSASEISITQLVVGDIVNLSTGDQIPADGLVLSSQALEVDESSMTGESDLVKKDKLKNPFLLSGTKVTDGYGSMLVTGVGVNTEWGKLMCVDSAANEKALERLDEQFANKEISEEEYKDKKEEMGATEQETPLQIRLNDMATKIGKGGLTVAILVLLVRIAKFLVYKYGSGNENYGHGKSDSELLVHDISIAVTIVVVAVPEGLPLAVTLSLAYSMQKMYSDNSLVRRLKACEAMGGATNICSDKTGTLTTNRMTVVQVWLANQLFKDQEKDCSDVKEKVPEKILKDSIASICLNSEVQVSKNEDGSPLYTGKATEIALVKYALQLGANLDEVREEFKVVKVEPFNSAKKKMGTLCQRKDGKYFVFWKGASEIVLDDCAFLAYPGDSKKKLSEATKEEVKGIIQGMAENSLRTICVSYKEVKPDFMKKFDVESDDIPSNGLTCLSIAGIKDPCRPGVPEAVKKCQHAGIVVRMITGDNITTAKAIARECNILTEDGLAIEGKEFRAMSYAERIKKFGPKLEKMQVMARSSPTDKFDLVHMLKTLDEVVAVTGDGTNDARALREADIGCSMGITGTEVAKQSSDIVILDDNFTTIVTMVRWGRCIYNNIQKFLAFQLTVNVVALSINFVGAVVPGAEPPFSPVQLLWVNMIMDSMGALALGTEDPTESLMDNKPYGRHDPLVTPIMWRNILGQAAFQLIVLFIFLFEGDKLFNLDKDIDHELTILNTIIFNCFVFCQIFNEMNARDMEKLNVFESFFTNQLFLFIIVISCVFQVIIVEFFGQGASVASLSWQQWLISVGIASITIPMGIVIKLLPVGEKGPWTLYQEWTDEGQDRSYLEKRLADVENELSQLKEKLAQVLSLQGSKKV